MENYKGCIDNQTDEQKELNYKFKEVVSAPQLVIWTEKPQSEWRHFNIRNQDGSSQCVCMTESTEMGILFMQKYGIFMDFSSCYLYQQRKHTEWGGCTSEDIYDVFPKLGGLFENYMPSQNIGESACMKVPKLSYYDDLAKLYKAKRIALPLDFETVASTVQATGKGVMIWVRFDHSEWTDIPEVKVANPTGGHSITVVDWTLKNGKKYLVIQDSWGLQYAMNGLRLISEEYFNARCFVAGYKLSFQMLEQALPIKPKYIARSISSAKDCFKWEGLFPNNIESNDIADNIFKGAVKSFQKRYNLSSDGIVGPITRGKLLEVYS